jgi:hypothetical protein
MVTNNRCPRRRKSAAKQLPLRLYWYTDLEQAQRVSAQSGKPILPLRLLGKLIDELSCANSRFFRTVLYSNAAVSAILRDQFVLHWQNGQTGAIDQLR